MKNVIKITGKYPVLFVSLYISSIIVVKIFTMMNIQYDNIAQTAFCAALFSMIIVGVINNFRNKKLI